MPSLPPQNEGVNTPPKTAHSAERGPKSIRRFEVEMTVRVTLDVDESVLAEDGDTILTRHANPEWQRSFYGDIGRDRSLMDLAVQVGVDGRRVSNVDGWADFPDEAIQSIGFPEWDPYALVVREER